LKGIIFAKAGMHRMISPILFSSIRILQEEKVHILRVNVQTIYFHHYHLYELFFSR